MHVKQKKIDLECKENPKTHFLHMHSVLGSELCQKHARPTLNEHILCKYSLSSSFTLLLALFLVTTNS